MPLEDAMPFLSRNFDNFVELMKQKISQANEWPTPDSKVAYYLNLLAEGRRVTLAEIIEVDKYVQQVMNKLRSSADRVPVSAGGGRMQPPMDAPRSSDMRPAAGVGLMGQRPAQQPLSRQGKLIRRCYVVFSSDLYIIQQLVVFES